METLTRDAWIDAVYLLLCQSQGFPANDEERTNLREWASSLAGGDCDYFAEGYSPDDAHYEELQAGL